MAEKAPPPPPKKALPSAGSSAGGGAGGGAAAAPPAPGQEPSSSPPRSPSPPEPFTYNFGAGSTGGGGGDGAAAAPPAPRQEPSSPLRSPSPPEPFTYNFGAGSTGGGGGDGAAAALPAPRQEPSSSSPRSPSPPEPFTYNFGAGSTGGGGGDSAAAAPPAPRQDPSSSSPRSPSPPEPFTYNFGAGSTGGGGGDGAAAAALPAPRQEPSSSSPRSPSPPEPFTYNFGAGSTGGGGGDGAAAALPAPRQEPSSSSPRSPSPPEPFTYNFGAGSTGGGGGDGAVAALPAPRQEPSSSSPRSPSPPEPFTYNFGAGSTGGGGGDGAVAALPAPRQEPSSSPPRSPSPPKPFTYKQKAVWRWRWKRQRGRGAGRGRGGATGPKLSYLPSPLSRPFSGDEVDDEKPDEFEKENGWGSLFMSDPQVLSMHDPQNLPRYIGRQKCDPISTQEFFALRHDWLQLLDGKKTYLRGTADSNYADSNFVTPKPLTVAVLCQESLSYLVLRGARKPITQQKFKILNEHYVCFRPMRTDGSQFYRAFLFSYLENLGKMQGSQAEVTRLMECVARSKVNFCRLEWNKAYFSNPKAFFSSVVSEFEHLVNSVANGLNADELYKISVQENSSSRSEDMMLFTMCLFICSLCNISIWLVLCLLRLLTEVHIRTHEVDYNRELSQNRKEKIKALLHCKKSVRPFDADADLLEMKALSQALGIPLHLAAVDDNPLPDRTVQVKWIDFIPRPGPLGSIREYYLGPLGSIRQYYLPSATDKHPVLPAENFLLSGRMPLVTILRTVRATAILYRK
eukprot:XP_008661800.1 uncharacterized LOC100279248 isoform X4 [Zea mays]